MKTSNFLQIAFLASATIAVPCLAAQATAPSTEAEATIVATYKLSGNRSVRPASVRDDGVRTEVRWSLAQAIPAVFAIGDQGREEVVNGYMRDDVFVIDRVYTRLVFRIDHAEATARRQPSGRR